MPPTTTTKPTVLHLGDPIQYNPATYALLASQYTVVRPSAAERARPAFVAALRGGRWGAFSALFRPFWGTGGEMGNWDAELISLLPDTVKVFASAGAGFDWVDTEALGARGIIYCNGGPAAAEAVADFAVAMVISTFRQLPWATAAATYPHPTRAGAERAFGHSHAHTTAFAHNPRAHTLALIGLGAIGRLVARKLGNPAFGMRVVYTDVVRQAADVERACFVDGYYGGPARGERGLRAMLGACDVVVVCAPARGDWAAILGREALGWLKRGARVVNVARGSLVDEEALVEALEEGRVGSAALDVHGDEPRVSARLVALAGGDVLRLEEGEGERAGAVRNPGRVMLTCHNAGGTVETHVGFEELAMRNVLAVLGGEKAVTPVNLQFLKRERAGESKL